MSGTRLPKLIFLALVLIALAQAGYNFPLLPDRLASHFNASGIPNGWMSKPTFFAVYAAMILIAAALEFLAPLSITRTPNPRLNLPHKGYWLAPVRRGETFAYFEKFFGWYGCAVLLLEILAMGLAIQANFSSPPQLPTAPIVALLVSFFLGTMLGVALMFRRFSRVPNSY